ncbi:BTAD domain-containing putative transcriptional regulator [Microtetraspora malaysiensis]|uniref:AfsR/SARP family transcriptional regulator n=1 Tax=Microtetraspora malaysiensis TaxID=161358 RepID=UPI003D8B5406
MIVDRIGPAYDFQVLGPLQVRVDGTALALPARHPRMLLAVLLLHNGEIIPEGRLLEQVWGHGVGSTIALRTAVSRLRSWLRDKVGGVAEVEHVGGGYRLRLPGRFLDAARFRAALAADFDAPGTDPHQRLAALMGVLELWHGSVLDGAPEGVREESEVRALEDEHALCLQRLAALAISVQMPELVLPRARALARTRPFDEPLHTRLIELHAACGRPAEALMEYERLRSRLAEELGIAPSADAQHAYLTVLNQDLPSSGSLDRSHVVSRDHHVVPRQAPPDIADFTGRSKAAAVLLDHLSGMLDDASRTTALIAGITGPAGAGKTTLAVHIAHRLESAYADGQLYADLRGAGIPESPAHVLGRFLRALGVPKNAVPDDPAERTALYRSLVSGRRMLVVLDDAADEAQVRPLLPGSPTCGVLMTSWSRLVGVGGARIVEIDRFDTDHAIQLLSAIVGHERVTAETSAAAELVALCDRLPLAVRICGARLAARPHWPLEGLVALLRDEHRRLDELSVADLAVRDGLRQSYARIRKEVRPTLARLARLGRCEFTTGTVAAVCGLDHGAAVDHLGILVEARFVSVVDTGQAGRFHYRVDDLARLFVLHPGGAALESSEGPHIHS